MNLMKDYFLVRPRLKKQLSLIKIPKWFAEKNNIQTGDIVNMGLEGDGLDTGMMFRVTSGQQLYVQKFMRDILKDYDILKITFIAKYKRE